MDKSAGSVGTPDSGGSESEDRAIVERIKWCIERISVGFDRWGDPHARGPGLYFVVERESTAAFVEPMGANRWPVEDCANVTSQLELLSAAAETVAYGCDGAVIVDSCGVIEPEMMRIKQLSAAERERTDGLHYAEWMGARHMSALETSTRTAVRAAITLSEEDGRMTVFSGGTYEDHPRDTLGRE